MPANAAHSQPPSIYVECVSFLSGCSALVIGGPSDFASDLVAEVRARYGSLCVPLNISYEVLHEGLSWFLKFQHISRSRLIAVMVDVASPFSESYI